MVFTKRDRGMISLCDMIDSEENLSKFQRLYEKYKNTMYSVAYDILKNTHDAEDAVEISLIKVIHMLDRIHSDDIDKPKGKNLMITVTKNASIDYLRKRENSPIPCEYIEDKHGEKNLEELYIEAEDYQDVIRCIDEMDDKYRDVLRLRVLYHLSSKEVGKVLNITEYTVNVRFMRAKAILSKKLEERGKNGGRF